MFIKLSPLTLLQEQTHGFGSSCDFSIETSKSLILTENYLTAEVLVTNKQFRFLVFTKNSKNTHYTAF